MIKMLQTFREPESIGDLEGSQDDELFNQVVAVEDEDVPDDNVASWCLFALVMMNCLQLSRMTLNCPVLSIQHDL